MDAGGTEERGETEEEAVAVAGPDVLVQPDNPPRSATERMTNASMSFLVYMSGLLT
jgi:hypothetical protein